MKPRSKIMFLLFFGLLLVLLASCSPAPYCDAIYNVTKTTDTDDGVCSPGDCSLREAVTNANVCAGPQTINLPAGGYVLTRGGDDEDLGHTGDLDITDDLTIIGTGAPSIHGGIERAFQIHSGAAVVFDHIWLADGSAIYGGGLVNEGDLTLNSFTCNYNSVAIPPGGMGDAMGGCIFNTGTLTIAGAQFMANTAGFGGALYNYDGATASITDATFVGNEADYHGGGAWNGVGAGLTIEGSSFENNQAGWDGGGIWNHGNFTGQDLVFENNTAAGNGGGFFNWTDGFAVFTNSWMTLNTAVLGGGLYNENGMVHLYESGLTSNIASGGAGGGAYNMGPSPGAGLLLRNVTISGNTAPGGLGGAGIYNTSNIDFSFITVADNNPEGIRIDGGAEIKIRSSALANNPGGNCAGIPPDSLGHNIEDGVTCAFAGWEDLPATDPLLEPLAPLGGMAPSHSLGIGSPAIDSGDPDRCTAIDQNGTARPQGPWCDRGAVENVSTKAIIRGWTYIDDNDNGLRDPGEGYVTGTMLTLKEGACPGAADLDTVESGDLGFYEILEIDPGTYCLASSPIQQTPDPVSYDLTLAAGDILEEINFRYPFAPMPDAEIHGKVWHDLCTVPETEPASPPPGCITLPGGGLGADGIYDPSEPGIEGVEVRIGMGACPITTILTSTFTDANGDYSFPVLFGGADPYCVTVNELAAPNDSILIPGNWTYPVRDASPAEMEVVVADGEVATDINFGWDYQLLPEPSSSSGALSQNAFCRKGYSTDYGTVTAFEKGTEVDILARSPFGLPLWFYIEELKLKIRCWISANLLIYQLDPDLQPTRTEPPPPTPTPTPLPCDDSLNREQCRASGGTWTQAATGAGYYCLCPKR
jgi:CSLREA domain-containing protein